MSFRLLEAILPALWKATRAWSVECNAFAVQGVLCSGRRAVCRVSVLKAGLAFVDRLYLLFVVVLRPACRRNEQTHTQHTTHT